MARKGTRRRVEQKNIEDTEKEERN